MKPGLPSNKEISKMKFTEWYVEKKNCVLCIPFILSGSPNDGLQSGIKLLRHGNFGEQNSIYLSRPCPLHSKLLCLLFSTRSLNSCSTQFHGGAWGGGGTPGNSWWGCAAQFSKSWPYFRPKDVISHTRFQTRPLKSMPVFRTGLYAEIMLSLLRLERKQKISSNPFQIRILLFLSYSFGIETMNTFIHSRSSFKHHTWFQAGKVFTCFQTEMAQKPYPMVRHILT